MQLPVLRDDIQLYGKLAQRKSGYVAGQVEVTSDCGQRCAMCESWRDHKSGKFRAEWSLRQMQEFCEELANMPTFEHLTLTGGDPQHWDPLSRFLEWFALQGFAFKLQLNTALIKPIEDIAFWRKSLKDVRVSLDGVDRKVYTGMRGDPKTNPQDVLKQIRRLCEQGISVATNTCVTTINIGDVPNIIAALPTQLRKAMFLVVIGERDTKLNLAHYHFWEQWDALVALHENRPGLSFAENPAAVREFLKTDEAKRIPCAVGGITFHIKCDGSVYPCCLTGGEAITTHPEFVLGNVHSTPFADIQRSYVARCDYGRADKPCSRICQWKQLNVNLAAAAASRVNLSMP